MQPITKRAVINALATAIYVVLVASFLFYAPKIFGRAGKADTVLAPITMLLLFVSSAALTGLLIFGQPALWYLEGRKKEALSLLTLTLGIFFAITLISFLTLVLYYSILR
ncbi:MAG: hypothetical protein HY313_02435 [Acidobacteria bacterium]|nr:hypothetical protein [Acidobacteriota bacterium]